MKKADAMGSYRIYWLGTDHRIKAALDAECASDEDACATAAEQIGDYPAAEIWHGARRVTRLQNPNTERVIAARLSSI
jgi:hypothetical protein